MMDGWTDGWADAPDPSDVDFLFVCFFQFIVISEHKLRRVSFKSISHVCQLKQTHWKRKQITRQ